MHEKFIATNARKQLPNALSERETADYIGLSISFLRQSRMDGPRKNRTPGPPFIKVGRSVRYLRADLDAWLAQHRVGQKFEQNEG